MNVQELVSQGKTSEAVAMLRAHLARKPKDVDALFQLGQLFLADRKTRAAERAFRDVIALAPEHGAAAYFLAEALRAEKAVDSAVTQYQEAARLLPTEFGPVYRLATMLHEAGRLDQARQAYEAALALNPSIAHAHNNLAAILLGQGAMDAALQHYVEALKIDPNLHEARLSLASVAARLGQAEVAANHYRAVLVKSPKNLIALRGLGEILLAPGRFDRRTLAEAEACWRGVLEVAGDDIDGHNNLGVVLGRQVRNAEAAVHFEKAIRLAQQDPRGQGYVVDPAQVENYAIALSSSGKMAEALDLFKQLYRHSPANANVALELLTTKLKLADWDGLRQTVDDVRSAGLVARATRVLPFGMLSVPGLDLEAHLSVARAYGEAMLGGAQVSAAAVIPDGGTDGTRVLRVGYVSSDYRIHPVCFLVLSIFEAHDREQVKVYAYSTGRDDGSEWRRRAERAPDVFRDVRELEDDELAAQIREDEIDILIDLNGWANEGRYGAFCLRPAAVQVGWLGYPGTIGLPGMYDYVIGDPVVTPLEDAPFYAETIAQLPHSYFPNDGERVLGKKPKRSDYGLPEDGFVFCCFNQAYKLNPDVLDAWCRVLDAAPASVLWLPRGKELQARDNLEREFVKRGVAVERLVWADHEPTIEGHLARLQLADFGLDSWPYNGHATAADLLWAGVPMAAVKGTTFAGRVSESLLRTLGMPELVADSVDGYVELVVALAKDPAALRSARAKLKRRRKASPLFDTKRFASDLERMYRQMWLQRNAATRQPIVLEEA
ncbi:tetratricopeptide repeat protein [Azoarcus sp. L1K30]|uniref:tetratricopeptide repeat protein n=1 Tax=Azoarcus sp. L1K30 TaxID=2820277 RepID=UPI001B8384A9|nr:tetratricopeptide repeat protein [Azoarcus sp. L1K30]MBR0567239.1 tetratricopeptide repeat protein [Azoarcus sp. L1K30]